MSASRFVASADQLTAVGAFLVLLTEAASKTGVSITGPIRLELENESTISVAWDEDIEEFLVDDTVGAT